MSTPGIPHPDPDLSPERFQELGYRTVDILTEHFATVREKRVYPDANHETIASAFEGPPPETGEDPDAILDAFEALAEAGRRIDDRWRDSASLPV